MKGSDWVTYKRLLSYVGPYWPLFLLSAVGFLIGSGAEAYFAKLFGDLIDSLSARDASLVMGIPLLMFAAALVRGLGEVVGELLLSQISFNVVHGIRVSLFDQLVTMPNPFFDANSQGHLVSRITYTVAQLRDAGTDALKTLIQDSVKVVVYFAVMFYLSWKLTLIFVATAPLVALVVFYASRRFRRISRRIQHSMGDVTHVSSEMVNGYRVVKIFGGEDYEKARFRRASRANFRQNLKMVATKVASTQLIQILVAAALSLLIFLLLRPELGGALSAGTVVTFLGLAGMLARPIKKLSEVNAKLQRGIAAAEDVFTQLDTPAEQDRGTVDVARVEGRIEFQNVSFTYDAESGAVLRDVNLIIEPGETVALVGKSGSGKSTLAALIPRFYEPDSGSILIDGVAIADYRLQALRRQIALVNQQVVLFNDSLAHNVAYGALADADPAAIEEALARAHAADFVAAMPQGMNTVVGDDGVLLSGGQRQRVAIARALLKDAPILILDEATSALDSESERAIQGALEEVMRGRTTLVIAHRLSTIERADRIVVMDHGAIIETGDHDTLLRRGGAYAALYEAQFADQPKLRKRRGRRGRTGSAESAAPGAAPSSVAPDPSPPETSRSQALTEALWYSDGWSSRALSPLSSLVEYGARRRRHQYQTGRRISWRAPVPVIIVGNLTVGGSGKTPLVIWLVSWLRDQGFQPGVVSRGYGGRHREATSVDPAADPVLVGDEAVLIVRDTGMPMVVAGDRVAAVQKLLTDHPGIDVVVADDGLQHYALERDLEIAVFDGARGAGNGRLLPAGPLREPLSRLESVDWVVSTGQPTGLTEEETVVHLLPQSFIRVGESGPGISCGEFLQQHPEVHLVAGIGHPARFEKTLRQLGFRTHLHAWPDHHPFKGPEVEFGDALPVICTAKDAVKLERVASRDVPLWFLDVSLSMPGSGIARLQVLCQRHGLAPAAGDALTIANLQEH